MNLLLLREVYVLFVNRKYNIKENQTQNICPVNGGIFKVYPLMISIMAVLQMMSILYGRKFIIFLGFNVAMNSVVFVPLILYVFQIVAECYGWQYGRQIVWCNFIFNGVATIILFVSQYIRANSFTHPEIILAYRDFVNTLWVSALLNWILIFIADYISTILTTYFKYITKGYGLLLRVFLINLCAELFLSLGAFISLPYNGYSIHETSSIVFQTFFARILAALIFSPIAFFMIWIIQNKIEQVIVFDLNFNLWNIFRWNIKPRESLQFVSKEWDQLSKEKKKNFDGSFAF